MGSHLPEELVNEILLRLPVKSLLRFKCVCKFWYGLIKSPSFVSKHFQFNNNSSLVVKCCDRVTCKHVMSSIDDETLEEVPSVDLDLPHFFKEKYDYEVGVQLLGPVNGVFCVFGGEDVVLWNPATRESKPISPVYPFDMPPNSCMLCHHVGFGFDSKKTQAYKLFRTFTWGSEEECYQDAYCHAELYNLSRDSWREMDPVLPSQIRDTYNAHLNGACHWFGNDCGDCFIVSLDMADEVFQKLKMPPALWTEFAQLAVLNDYLALLTYYYKGRESCFDVWVMSEYGIEESWTKIFTVGPFTGVVELPVGYGKKGEVFLQNKNGQLIRYDPWTNEIKNIEIPHPKLTFQVISYKESLVSIS